PPACRASRPQSSLHSSSASLLRRNRSAHFIPGTRRARSETDHKSGGSRLIADGAGGVEALRPCAWARTLRGPSGDDEIDRLDELAVHLVHQRIGVELDQAGEERER